jgi:probable rRNA maturation factor
MRDVLVRAAEEPALARRLEPGGERELTVRITGDRELRRLNRDFLGLDEVTDVLSFPSGDSTGYLGDLALSWPAVVRQAEHFGHSEADELALLCVHGLLHLLGWDHETAEQERAMWEETHRCLAAAGVTVAGGRLPLRSGGRPPAATRS